MVQESALWPSAMIGLGPHWHKVNELALLIASGSSTANWWLYKAQYCYNTITHSETKLYGTIIINILVQL